MNQIQMMLMHAFRTHRFMSIFESTDRTMIYSPVNVADYALSEFSALNIKMT
jgi:hypothetical protein